VLALLGFALLAGGNQLLFQNHLLWFAWAIPAVQLALGWVWAMGIHSVRAHVHSEILENTLAYHLPKERARQLKDRPDLLRTHGEKTPVTFMFTDIENFTTISDRTPPDTLFQNLNDYFQHVVPAIHDTGGTVMQFVGDAIYAIWNAPTAQVDYADRAIRAGIELERKLAHARAENKAFAFTTRIGLHAGFAYVGNCGSSDRFEYAAIGKDTNLAARLEGLNKYLGTRIVASAALVHMSTGGFLFRPLGYFRVKGSDRVPEVYEVLGYADESHGDLQWIHSFTAGLGAFHQRNWDGAESAFNQTLDLRPDDRPSRFYLDAIAENRANPPDSNWRGEVVLSGK